MMKPVKAMCIAVAGLTSLATPALPEISIVADEWPPFSGADLPRKGISLDVISMVLTRAGYDVSVEVLPWPRIISGARLGEYDVVGSLFYDAEIDDYMTYGDPFYSTEIRFVHKIGTHHEVTDLNALRPYSIAVGDGFLYEAEFDRADFLDKIVVANTTQALQMVAHGRADLTLDSQEVLKYSIAAEGPGVADAVEILPHVLARHNIHMAVRDTLPEKDKLIEDFNRTLADMRRNGTLDQILEKHRQE